LEKITIFAFMKGDKDIVSVDISVNDWDKKIVKMLAEGFTIPEISKGVGQDVRNIEYKLAKLKARLQCKTSAQLVAFFIKNKLVN